MTAVKFPVNNIALLRINVVFSGQSRPRAAAISIWSAFYFYSNAANPSIILTRQVLWQVINFRNQVTNLNL
ncbi:MAG: hypothetical protein JWP00_4016 [Chloroflexi bacterium]|nr:hypothetical protein [Chloroflexota bacterium]